MANVLMQGFDQPSHVAFQGKFGMQPRQRAQGQYAGGLAGTIERLLPAIGSVGGAVGGTLLAPGLGTAAGGAGGAVLGQKLEDMLTGQHTSAGGYAGQAALGSLGGIGKAAEAIGGAANVARAGEGLGSIGSALRFGGKGAAAVADTGAQGFPKVLQATQASTGQSIVPKTVQNVAGQASKQSLLSQAEGLTKGVAQSAVRDAQGIKDLGYSSIGKMAEHAPLITGDRGILTAARNELANDPAAKPIDTSGFMQFVKDHIGSNVDLTSAQQKNILTKAESLAQKYGFAGDENAIGQAHPANFSNAMKDIFNSAYTAAKDSPARKTLVNIGNDMRSTLQDSLSSVPFTADMKNGIVNALRSGGVNKPQVIQAIRKAQTGADLANIESKFVTASNVARDSAESALKQGVGQARPGLTQELNQAGAAIVGKPAKTAISAVTGGISKLAGKGAKQAPETLGQLAGQTAKSVGLTQGLVRAPGLLAAQQQAKQPQQDQSQADLTGSATDTSGLGQTDLGSTTGSDQTGAQQDMGGLTPELIQRAMVADLAGGGKHVGELATLYNTFLKPQQPSADQQKRMDNMSQAGATLQEYYNQLQQAGGGKGLAVGPAQSFLGKIGLGGQTAAQAKALEATRVDIATTLAQAMTGNSRPAQQQVNLWLNSIPQISDPQPVAAQKLQNIMGLIQARQGALQ